LHTAEGLKIGAIFTGCSLLLTVTFVIPIISVLPGVIFELIAKTLVPNDPYSNVGLMTILLMCFAFILMIIIAIRGVKKYALKNQHLIKEYILKLMVIFFLFVHPLGFYIYWGAHLNFASDGQLLFAAIYSFPISSFAFVLYGLFIDWVRDTSFMKAKIDAELSTEI